MESKYVICTPEGDEIPLELNDFVEAKFIDEQIIRVLEFKGDTIALMVKNPNNTNLAETATIHLSLKSFTRLIACVMLYTKFRDTEFDFELETLLKNALSLDEVIDIQHGG